MKLLVLGKQPICDLCQSVRLLSAQHFMRMYRCCLELARVCIIMELSRLHVKLVGDMLQTES